MGKLDNPHAFPACNEANVNGTMGMTLRDWFAGQALTAWLADGCPRGDDAVMAAECYVIANAMLAERQKGGEA